jgi:hypothetical protein
MSIPQPIRQALEDFRALAHNPPLYLAAVQYLDAAVLEMAKQCAEEGACPCCGADTGVPPQRYPDRIGVCRRCREYCFVCGEPAIEEPITEPFKWEPDWDLIHKDRDHSRRRTGELD